MGVFDAAVHHHLASALYLAVRDRRDVAPELLASLAAQYREGVERHVRACADLRQLASVMRAAGVPWAAVKGPVLAELAYRRPDLRSYVDLDVLIAPEHLGAALHALAAEGVHPGASVDALTEARWAEVPMALWHGTTLDLHWHLLARPEHRRSLRWSTNDLLSRAVTRVVGDGPVPVLDPIDQVLHITTHACLSGGDRLRWWADTGALVERRELDWVELEGRARAVGVAPMAGIMLDRARWWLGRGAPEEVIDRLGGRTWWADRANVAARRALGPGKALVSGRLMAGATRQSLPSSLREAARLLLVRRIRPGRSATPVSIGKADAPGAIARFAAMACADSPPGGQ